MSFFDFFRKPSPKTRKQNTKSLKFESLENREMLSINSILPELYTDTITAANPTAAMYLELKSDDTNKWVTVGLVFESADGSELDPSKITVKYQQTDSETEEVTYVVVPDYTILAETDGEKKSSVILNLPAGTYQISIGGDNSTIGEFTVDAYVPGGTEESPTSVPQYTPLLVQAGLHQMSGKWNTSMESIYRNLLGTNYRTSISSTYPELNVTETGRLNEVDARILGIVANSGNASAALTKTEPEPEDPVEGDLSFSAATLTTKEKSTEFSEPTAEITVTGGSAASLKDYTVTLNATYTITDGTGGVDFSDVTLPTLESGTDYKFEDGKFYFNPNGNFDFIPKGTTATLTLKFTATDKTDTTKTGIGTITVMMTGANDAPELDKTEVDLKPDSTLSPVEVWSEPWSTTSEGVTTYRSDEIAMVIDGKNIKVGNTVVATISDIDVGDTFEFATIGYPSGTVTFENSTWTLWNGTGENRKAAGEIRLSTDKRTLYYKAAGARSDSAFSSLADGELSDILQFTFTVKDNSGVTTTETDGDKNEKSETGSCAVEFQVKRKVDAQMGLSITSTGTTSVSIKSQSVGQDEASPTIPLTSFFSIDFTGQKNLEYNFVDMTVSGSSGLTIPMEVDSLLRETLEIFGGGKTDGIILFNRSSISVEANEFLNDLAEGEYVDVTFKIKIANMDSESEYVVSETLHIKFQKSVDLDVANGTLAVSQHDTTWIASAPIEITGGVGQVSSIFYDLDFTANYQITYTVEEGEINNPTLTEGEDYKCEIVVMDAETGKLGVKFSFNPNGKFDFLNVGQNANVQFYLSIEDVINPILFKAFEWEITVRGEEEGTTPMYKNNVNLSVDENQSLMIEGSDIAESTKTDADLVIGEVRVKVEDVEKINDATPDTSSAVNGYYKIIRPTEDEQTILLKSGTLILLDADGKIKFDPTGRTDNLSAYLESDSDTYADEKLTILVYDTSGTTPIPAATTKEFTIRVKGVEDNPAPTFKTLAEDDLGAFQNDTFVFTAADIASSTKTNAELKIKSITFDADEVTLIDGETPGEPVDGYHTVTRPTSGETTVTFKTGATITFDSEGNVTFDPTEIEAAYLPYVPGQVETYHDEYLRFIVEDTSAETPIATVTDKEFRVRAKGVIYPLFLNVSLTTSEDAVKIIRATDVASSTKEDSHLVIQEVYVNADDVELVNGATPGTATDEKYKITRPESGTQTITLKSGSEIALDAAGEVAFDPTGRDGELPPFDASDTSTYANEKFSVLVHDTSGVPVDSKTTREFTIQVTGVQEAVTPTFKPASEVNLYTNENNPLTISATDLAESEKSAAQLIIHELYIKEEYVDKINDAAPTEEPVDGYYKLSRPPLGPDYTVTLKSGSIVRLSFGGLVTFVPTGRTADLPPYDASDPTTYANEEIEFLVRDINGVPASTTTHQAFNIQVRGVADDIVSENAPTFKTDVDLSTDERELLIINASDIATSENADARLVIETVSVDQDEVRYIDDIGVIPAYSSPPHIPHSINRPETGERSITLYSGTKIRLTADGVVIIDPSGRDGALPTYAENDPTTYANEKIEFIVADISGDEPAQTQLTEFTLKIKGSDSTGLLFYDGPFNLNTFATVDEMPESLDLVPTYKINGVTVSSEQYEFSLVGITASFDDDNGEYSVSVSSPLSVDVDGKVLVNKTILERFHQQMGAGDFSNIFFKVQVKATANEGGTEFVTEIPVSLKYVAPPHVETVTTLDGVEIAAGAAWNVSKAGQHSVSVDITISDTNVFPRDLLTGWTVSEIALLDWKYGDAFESWTKSQVEQGMAGDAELAALYEHVTSLLDAEGTAFTLALENLDVAHTSQRYRLEYDKADGTSFYDFIEAGHSLEFQYQILVTDNTYHGQTPLNFTIIING